MHTTPDDASGYNTQHYLDQEQLMRNIEAAIEAEAKCTYCGVKPEIET